MPTLLILVLGLALVLGLICLLLVVHFLRTGRRESRRLSWRGESFTRERRFHPPLLAFPRRWLAIRSGNPYLVQAALGLHKPTPCSWEEGLCAAHERKLFISPPVRGWIFVMGSNLPEPADDVDKCFRFILDLSRKLGQVQFFSVNRAVSHHGWVLADQGRIIRAYAWAGKTLWNQGRLTRAEIELRLKCYDYTEPVGRTDFTKPDPVSANAEKVPLLAARWSLDPAAIDAAMLKESQGIAGELSQSRIH